MFSQMERLNIIHRSKCRCQWVLYEADMEIESGVHGVYLGAPHSSTLAWKIPWMEEPGGLQSMGSLGVGQD